VRGSRTHAQRELVSFAALANVSPVVGARTTTGELLDRWFAVNESNWARTTVKSTRSIIDCQLGPGLGHVLVRELTTVMIDEFYASLRIDRRQDGKPLSPGSVRWVHGVLHRALAQAMRWEWIWANPAAYASAPRVEPVEMRPPTPEEVNRLLEHVALSQPLFHLFLVLAAPRPGPGEVSCWRCGCKTSTSTTPACRSSGLGRRTRGPRARAHQDAPVPSSGARFGEPAVAPGAPR
jgi:Phage integrase, N-terminal SAM-like domain